MRKSLNQFDRIIGPLAEALETVVADDLDRFPDAAAPYLRDVAGEIGRASSEVDALRELVDHIVDANLVLRDYRQNVVMKKVTSWAAIIAVPTLITGFYGMNVPYPGSGETWGVVAATAARRRLLGQPLPPVPPQAVALIAAAVSRSAVPPWSASWGPRVVGRILIGVDSAFARWRMRREAFVDELGDPLGQVGQRSSTSASRLVDALLGRGHHGVDDDLHVDAVGLGHLGDGLTVAQGIAQGVLLDADGLRRSLAARCPGRPGRRARTGHVTVAAAGPAPAGLRRAPDRRRPPAAG